MIAILVVSPVPRFGRHSPFPKGPDSSVRLVNDSERITQPPPISADEFAALVMSTAEEPSLPSPISKKTPAPPAPISTTPPSESDQSGRYCLANVNAEEALLQRKIRRMNKALAAQDFASAHHAALQVLDILPRHPDALRCVRTCRRSDEISLLNELGGLQARLALRVPDDQLEQMQTDAEDALLLSLLDGDFTLGEVLEVRDSLRLETLCWLRDLVNSGLIVVS